MTRSFNITARPSMVQAANVARMADPLAAARLRRLGSIVGESLQGTVTVRSTAGAMRRRTRAVRKAIYSGRPAHPSVQAHRRWLSDNARLIAASVKDVEAFALQSVGLPATGRAAELQPRVSTLSRSFLEATDWQFDEKAITEFLRGADESCELRLDEIWATRQAVQLVLLEQVVEALTNGAGDVPAIVTSLRAIAECRWKDVFRAVNRVDEVLALDPEGVYARMDEESRELYRGVVTELARGSGCSERDVASVAVALACAVARWRPRGRAAARRCHIGFYLVDDGLALLKQRVGYRPTFRQRVVDGVMAHPASFYLSLLTTVSVLAMAAVVAMAGYPAYAPAALVLLLFPATQAGLELTNAVATALVGPRRLPKLDFDGGVPAECATLVAVPALLLNERYVRDLVMDMEIRYLANRDPNISFALVTNAPDSEQRPTEQDAALQLCQRLVGELNERYGTDGRTPFHLLHRYRRYSASEERWIGWERKRGKLLELNRFLRGVADPFPVKVGNSDALCRVTYVIVLDADTELPRDAARRLIGAMAHPLNRAVFDPETRTVVEGYGILQPRLGVTVQSATRSSLASLYSGDTGFDIYTRAVSDVYQDLFGEGIFTGKGIYEVDIFRVSLEHRFPENALLSHDLIEGLFARAGLVSDIELLDDYPSHFSAYCRRRHRWMRGDWQILRWLLNRVPDGQWRLVRNPLGPVARWKILDNLRRTLVEPATLLLLLFAWFILPNPGLWTLAIVAVLLAPAYGRLAMALPRAPWRTASFRPWVVSTFTALRRSHVMVALRLVYLLHDALLAADAVLRALARMFVTRRRLLEWETAAEASLRSKGATDPYLVWTPVLAAGLALSLALVRPEALVPAAPFVLGWMAARAVVRWLNRPPSRRIGDLSADDVSFLREHALRTWMYFATFSAQRNNWLIPDSVQADGSRVERLSPTNLAMLLNARIAAVHLGYLTVPEFVRLTSRTLGTVRRLRLFQGHLLNWYDNTTLQALEPRFVSTVDSGNLAAALWALKQSALSLAREAPGRDVLWDGIADVARLIGRDPAPAARALSERVLRTRTQWRDTPELEGLVAHFAAGADGDMRRWAEELLARLQQARACEDGPVAPDTARALQELAREADTLVADMDFAFLYDRRRKVLSIGYDLAKSRPEPAAYDLLASEARTAAFVAVAKGDVPQESWFHLGRTLVAAHAERVLLSWTGTLFEYLMPALWFRNLPHTIMHDTMRAALAVQRKFARLRGVPWGFSESACIVPDAMEYGYAPCGLPDLALKPLDARTVVVSPYSTFLALLVDRTAALANLRALHRLGCVGTFGFHEAIDYSRGAPDIVRSWMAHHQGMSLIAAAEVLAGAPLQQAFHAEPHVRATERLLDECVPVSLVPDEPVLPRLNWPEEPIRAASGD